MSIYQVGDTVQVEMYDGWKDGEVVKVLKKYAFSKETKYEVHGKELVTIISARGMRAAA